MTMSNIVAGFRVTGVYPLDHTAVPVSAMVKERGGDVERCESLAERMGLLRLWLARLKVLRSLQK